SPSVELRGLHSFPTRRSSDLIEKFLADVYEPAGEGRYSYIPGTTAAGLVVYEDGKFAYSFHGSDPAGGKLLNAFDLVRVHKFGQDRKSTRLNSSHVKISYAVF